MPYKESLTKKELFSAVVEDALNEIGTLALDMVWSRLVQEYHCSIADCLGYPEYLKKVLNQIFGYADMVIIERIKERLAQFSSEQPVHEFLLVFSK